MNLPFASLHGAAAVTGTARVKAITRASGLVKRMVRTSLCARSLSGAGGRATLPLPVAGVYDRSPDAEMGMDRPTATFGSPVDDRMLWRCATQERKNHGDAAMVHALQRMYDLGAEGDHHGAATWAAIVLRLTWLGPVARDVSEGH